VLGGQGKGGNWDQKAGRFGRPGLKETNQTKHHLIAAKSKRASRKREKGGGDGTARLGRQEKQHTYMASCSLIGP